MQYSLTVVCKVEYLEVQESEAMANVVGADVYTLCTHTELQSGQRQRDLFEIRMVHVSFRLEKKTF